MELLMNTSIFRFNCLGKGIPSLLIGCLFFVSCTADNKPGDGGQIRNTSLADTTAAARLLDRANSYLQTNFDSVYYYALQAQASALQAGYIKGVVRARAVEANALRRKGKYPEAIQLALQVAFQLDSLQLFEEAVYLRNIIADTYKEMGGEKGTMEYLSKALEMARANEMQAARRGFSAVEVMSLNLQGIILRDISRRSKRNDLMDTALLLYRKALGIFNITGKGEEHVGKIYNNISQVYNEHLKDYPTALEYLQKAVQYNQVRNNLNSLSFNYGNISDVYMKTGDLNNARRYAHRMMETATQLNAPHRIVNALNQLTRVYKSAGQYDSALYFKEWYILVADSLNNLEKTAQIADMQTRYETGKKDARIEKLSELNEVKNQRFWLLAVASFILATLLLVVWMQKRKSQRQEALITNQADRLQWMMKELHHRVKNNLQIVSSLLNLQAYRLKDEQSTAAFRESQLRVQAMSLMHQRLYQVEDVSMINFKLYLTDLTETLMQAYGYDKDAFDLEICVDQEMLNVDTVMPLGLLVNEIVTNSFKYAYPGLQRPSLKIKLQSSNNQLELSVSDNGPGIPANSQPKGFGQNLIMALSRQLKATVTQENENGASYHFTIPYQEKAA
jgi:two-component sensor histidine kinase/tetratricopeptide (TPR) repeat protein